MAILTESTRLIWPAPIPSVASSSATTIALDFTCRQTRQANSRSRHSRLGRLPLGDDLQLRAVGDDDVAVLHEQPAVDLADVEVGVALAPALLVLEDADVRLLGQQGERVLVVAGCDEHLDELLRRAPAASCEVDRRLSAMMPPNALTRIAGERLAVGVERRRRRERRRTGCCA